MQCEQLVNMVTWCILIFIIVTVNHANAQGSCNTCVSANSCYQSYIFDGQGQIDVRIVNPNTPVQPPVVTQPGSPCAAGNEQCCTGPGISGCGIRYNIPTTPATIPRAGEAAYGSQPWQASMLRTGNLAYVGGAVLINPTTVMTVAHKVALFVAIPNNITVRLGDWDVSGNVEPFPTQDRVVVRITLYPYYNPNNLQNDIAILKLASAVTLAPSPTPAINTACPPNATAILDGRRCLVAGWGQNAFNGTLQARMKLINVPIISNNDCQQRLRTTKLGATFILNTESFLCAGGEAGIDACLGDGGSALVCNIGGRYQVVGLVAWGIGCANPSIPGVYVRVSSYLQFLNSNS